MKNRIPKEDDQEKVDVAIALLVDLSNRYPQIDTTLWVSACYTLVANAFKENDCTYEDFVSEGINAITHYRRLWDEE